MNRKYIVYIQGSFEIEAKDEKEAFDLMIKKFDKQKFPVDSYKIADKVSGFIVKES